jgi:hypothetical protein
MRTNKTFVVCLSLLCAWIVFVVLAVPAVLAYEWLGPVGFWQKLAFALTFIVVGLFPFRRIAKPEDDKATRIPHGVAPASLRHREMTQAMRDAATSYGILPKRQIN